MHTAYPLVITEDEATLRQVERAVRGRPIAVRVQALRLLKSGAARSLPGCATLVGHSPRQVARWWATYRRAGLEGLLREPTHPGRTPRLTPAALADLETVMAAGQIATLKEAQAYLAAQHGIVYPQPQRGLEPTAQAPHQAQDRPPSPCARRCGGAGGLSRRVSRHA